MLIHWDDGLDEEFIAIAGYTGSYLCIIAGAGTGKSYALKRKVARLLEEGESPGYILAVTFTRTAARDLNRNLHQLDIEGCDLIRACTLHSLCFSILGRHEVFRVMERHTRTLLEHEEDYLLSDLSVRLRQGIRVLREQLHAFTSAWARLLHEEPGWPHTDEDKQFDREMIAWLRFHKAMLVGELIPLTIRYLRNNPTCPERSQYKHIIVDEYQDLNRAEQELVKLLSEYHLPENRTLTVAGDDDQSIFVTLKYAHPEGIISFKDEYPGTYETTLLVCKRCPKKVISLANAFIKSTNRKERPKLLKPAPDAIDGEVVIVQWRMLKHEAAGIAAIIANKIASGEVRPEEVLVLTPRKQIGYDIVNSLESKGIKAQTCFSDAVLKGNKLAQEGYAYLTLLHDRNDVVSLRVLLGITANDRKSTPYDRIRKHCFESGDTVVLTLSKLQSGKLRIPYTDSLVERYNIINQRLDALSIMTLPAIIENLFPDNVDEVAEIRKLVLSVYEKANDIHELFNLINTEIIQPELPATSDSVLVLTLYKAKGLTAKMVVIANCLEGCIPYIGDYSNEREKQETLAEQERLFFVSLTRTTNILIISGTAIMRRGEAARLSVVPGSGRFWLETQPSRFIDMLGKTAPTPIIGEDYVRQVSL
jgi:DNA helicase II / ATP-dependent DNA helicase PcrA